MAEIGLMITLVGMNLAVVGILVGMFRSNRQPRLTNGKNGRSMSNPGVDPDEVRIGDVSVGYFEKQRIEAINECMDKCRQNCGKAIATAVKDGFRESTTELVKAIQEGVQGA